MDKKYSKERVIEMLEVMRNVGYAQGSLQGYIEGRQGFMMVNEGPTKSKLVILISGIFNKRLPREIRKKINIDNLPSGRALYNLKSYEELGRQFEECLRFYGVREDLWIGRRLTRASNQQKDSPENVPDPDRLSRTVS